MVFCYGSPSCLRQVSKTEGHQSGKKDSKDNIHDLLLLLHPFSLVGFILSLYFHQQALLCTQVARFWNGAPKSFPKPEESSVMKLCIEVLRRTITFLPAVYFSCSLLIDVTAQYNYKRKLFFLNCPEWWLPSTLGFTFAKET